MKYRHICSYLIPVLLLLSVSTPCAMAQETKETVTSLEDLTVTARPIIQGNQADTFGSMKTIITQDQLDALNAQDLETALKMTPGVSMSRFNPVGSFGGADGGGVFIRGMGSSRPGAEIKMLVDGAPMFMSVWNHPLLDLMSIDMTESIEVYKSPQPQYFGNAVGVVNILPRRKKVQGFYTSAQAAFGSYDTHVAKVAHGGKSGDWDYYIGGGFRESQGHRDHADGELKNMYGRIGKRLSDHWDLTVFSLINDNWANDPGQEDADPSLRQGRYETRAWLTTATLSSQYEKACGEIKLYRSSGEGDWLDQPTSTDNVTEDLFNDFLFYGAKVKETVTLGNGGTLLAGVDWDYTEGDYTQEYSNDTSDVWDGAHFDTLSPYAALSWQLGTVDGFHVTPSAGGRFYEHSQYDGEWAPHAGLAAGWGPWEFHMGYARGVVYPGLEVVVMSEDVLPALGQTWKDLDPEIVDHYEVGFSMTPCSRFMFDLVFFYEDGKDRYVIVPYSNGSPPHYDNVETFTIRGLEATANWQPLPDLSLFTGITLLDPDPTDLPYAPDTSISCGMNYRFLERFKLSLDASYVSSMHVSSQVRKMNAENSTTVDSFFLVNGKISCALDLKGMDASVFLAGENLTDADYNYQTGYPMPGINCMAGIEFSL